MNHSSNYSLRLKRISEEKVQKQCIAYSIQQSAVLIQFPLWSVPFPGFNVMVQDRQMVSEKKLKTGSSVPHLQSQTFCGACEGCMQAPVRARKSCRNICLKFTNTPGSGCSLHPLSALQNCKILDFVRSVVPPIWEVGSFCRKERWDPCVLQGFIVPVPLLELAQAWRLPLSIAKLSMKSLWSYWEDWRLLPILLKCGNGPVKSCCLVGGEQVWPPSQSRVVKKGAKCFISSESFSSVLAISSDSVMI